MFTREYLVARLNNQPASFIVKSATDIIGIRCDFPQSRISRNHLPRDQVPSYVEMFKRPLRLCPPQFVARYVDFTEAVGLFPNAYHHRIAGCTHCAHHPLSETCDAS